MNYLQVNLDPDRGWLNANGSTVRGSAFAGDELKQGAALAKHFEDAVYPQEFVSLLEGVNGFYAVVLQKGSSVMAAVDRVRSIPLFYAFTKNKLFLSDNAEWVRQQIGDQQRDSLAETEFLLTGYVTGEDTLYPNVKQLRAGELLAARVNADRVTVEKIRYYRYTHTVESEVDKDALEASLDHVVINCVHRLIRWADGRSIVIPLSGGYDSRLIATMLRRLGYDHIMAFSYGRPGNKEAEYSKWIAKSLDIPWYFIPYSNEAWLRWFHSQEREAYYRFAHNLTSLPHIQDWPAVQALKNQGLIEPNAVFVPGHSGDFLAGSHIPKRFFAKISIGKESFLEEVLRKHYSLWPFDNIDAAMKVNLQERIVRLAEVDDLMAPERAVDAFERWDWQERQAKFIVNSVRVYEFWGHNWWLPLWDAEMMEFWAGVPLELRKEQQLYIDYVTRIYSRMTGLASDVAAQSSNNTPVSTLRQAVKQTHMFPLAKAIYRIIKQGQEYYGDPLAIYGIVPRVTFDALYSQAESINSYLVKDILGHISL